MEGSQRQDDAEFREAKGNTREKQKTKDTGSNQIAPHNTRQLLFSQVYFQEKKNYSISR